MLDKKQVSQDFMAIQDYICKELELVDGKAKFKEDKWNRAEGGGGRTRIIGNGNIIEKGGVAFSAVEGPTPEKILKKLNLEKADFFATGVSIVIHPESPMIPIIHMNIRYFEMSNGINWFGGGIDLTPHYVDENDAKFFHQAVKETCDQFNPEYYPKFKNWADDYFYIKHRNETRGVGGIFFDRLTSENAIEQNQIFEFAKSIGYLFPKVYTHFMNKNHKLPYGENEKSWQALRRGRYVEFNLVWDAGTKFGLDTNGRTESILMSMPPQANWEYMHEVKEGSEEEKTLSLLKKGLNWV
ncbi:oxygen-dependent coproporphyrinogen oxidase [Belliella aquatica]|uniref:coproporphyrinogen oxidase n=1 Tax=Belliella aquatica TaxID=1323734 RepID=A0ABQ1LVD1_9BACT|nr:oxygen-dependent coproporphyrinogen oxidase [Belliella aquatica]MCH7405814.1 oxygen-dependent coproporphyrinogen oxidase [Belliella aquatica]GGC30521.1 coproporphyrinogen oxidase [Belliella aquatica]